MTRLHLPATEQLLLEGGDARIALDVTGVNKYGCPPRPDPDLLDFASSTASVVSEAGFQAADLLRRRLEASANEAPATLYARELDRMRLELLDLCGLSDETQVVFAASGTDLHLMAAQLAGTDGPEPTLAVMVDAAETGSSVPAAVVGRHFSSRSALGPAVAEGQPIAGRAGVDLVSVAIREADGSPRSQAAIDAEAEALVCEAAALGRPVLLIMVDVSKTGLVAPSPSRVLALQQRFPQTVTVLVDACQFRLSPETLRAYLDHGFAVALTGSKFMTGPTFSGALLLPAEAARRFRDRPLGALLGYSSRADWPSDWQSAQQLEATPNFGLLLRWEAALEELRAFRMVPEATVTRILSAFARAIQDRLNDDPAFTPVVVPRLDRHPMVAPDGWDHHPTIFPFMVNGPGGTPLNRDETTHLYRQLQGGNGPTPVRCQLGQPVACGQRDGMPVSALRLCASARLVVQVARSGELASVIARAMAVLDRTASLAAQAHGIDAGTSNAPPSARGGPDRESGSETIPARRGSRSEAARRPRPDR